MKKYLDKLPKEIQDLIYLAKDVAYNNNMSCYLVGGFVRDLILGVKNLDLDFVIEGEGIEFAQNFAHRLNAKLISHKRFGTATVNIRPFLKVDVATARRESYLEPASLPMVSPGSLKDDLTRRDFTINAMAIQISGENFGKLIDFFEGKADLDNRKIRILHKLSFIDDPTRILRAIRFEQRYNFKIEPHTISCLKEALKLKMLEKVQPQRIRDELIVILKEKYPLRPIRRIQKLLSFGFISPHLSLLKKHYVLFRSIERQISWFKRKFPKHRRLDTWLIYFMGLIGGLDIKEVKNILKKFVFSKGEEKRILTYKRISRKFILELCRSNLKPSGVFSLLEPLSYEVILLLKARYKEHNLKKHVENFFEIYNGMRISSRGDDLGKLGIAPGPDYKRIFTRVLKEKLEGRVKTKEEELLLIKKLIKK